MESAANRLTRRASIWPLALTALLLASGTPAAGFHDGGAASCSECHLSHGGAEGLASLVLGANGEPLLTAESASDLCLTCHADDFGAVLGSDPLAPPPEIGAGNFVFLYEDEINDTPGGGGTPIPGDAAGHNLVAPGHSLTADSRYTLSPGGSFPADSLGCTSCHDPHGNAEYRLLYGVGPVQGGIATFSRPAPEAEGIDLRTGVESPTSHVAYRDGMSAWCGNCHGRYHDEGASSFEHDSDHPMGVQHSQRYNEYNGDSDPTGGVQATAHLPDVPFEDRSASTTSPAGANSRSRVICLTCHRAHASSAPAAGRWDSNVTLLQEDGVASGSYPLPDPFNDPNQGTLCSKCHDGTP